MIQPILLSDDLTAIATAAHVVARAFQDNPFAQYIEPDPPLRAFMLGALFGTLMPFFRSAGLVHVMPGEIRAVAVWRPPLDGPATPLESLGPTPPLDDGQLARFLQGQAELDAVAATTFTERAWYLDFLAVDPAHQGGGLATALVAAVHAEADAAAVPCFLETFDGANVSFYERRGYEVAASVMVSFAVEPIVAMRRAPAVTAR